MPKETEERKIILFLHGICHVYRDSFHCSLINYCCVLCVLLVCGRGGGCPQGISLVHIRFLKWQVLQ